MKPALEHLPKANKESFVVKNFEYDYYPTPWHYHPEYELVSIVESTGRRIIGDHISDFKPGNLALIGPGIPHIYKNDPVYYQPDPVLKARSIVIHFTERSLGDDFLSLPEAAAIKALLEKAATGLDIPGETGRKVNDQLQEIVDCTGMKRLVQFLNILNTIAESGELVPISTIPVIGNNEKESARLCKVLDWITANFETNIKLAEAAAIAEMHENAFSRFFSRRTRKSFSVFVQELRLQKAAKLLAEPGNTITSICFDCGYNNVSNFNRQFMHYYKMNPRQYRKAFFEEN
jgi:AraC-like DNA-binding protein